MSAPIIRMWVIIGHASMGKSTTIRHLISQHEGRGGIRNVLLRGGGILTLFAKTMSLQEGNQEEEAAKTPSEFVNLVQQQITNVQNQNPAISAGFFNVIFSLRYDPTSSGPHSYPYAYDYLSHFVGQGCQIESLVLMAPDAAQEQLYQRFGSPTLSLHDPRGQPISRMVERVRNHFGWA